MSLTFLITALVIVATPGAGARYTIAGLAALPHASGDQSAMQAR